MNDFLVAIKRWVGFEGKAMFLMFEVEESDGRREIDRERERETISYYIKKIKNKYYLII